MLHSQGLSFNCNFCKRFLSLSQTSNVLRQLTMVCTVVRAFNSLALLHHRQGKSDNCLPYFVLCRTVTVLHSWRTRVQINFSPFGKQNTNILFSLTSSCEKILICVGQLERRRQAPPQGVTHNAHQQLTRIQSRLNQKRKSLRGTTWKRYILSSLGRRSLYQPR